MCTMAHIFCDKVKGQSYTTADEVLKNVIFFHFCVTEFKKSNRRLWL